MESMRSVLAVLLACIGGTAAWAAECPGHPDALGTSRTIVVDPTEHARLGTMQYHETLPLDDKEVVLTFDDGPLHRYSPRVLDILAAQCVKATFFIVGRQAQAYPDLVRRAYNEGHTIATHSQNHPFRFDHLPLERARAEIDGGIASTADALGDAAHVAPFFRVPGLRTSAETEAYLASRGIQLWSADFPADDWRHISAKQVTQRALDRLQRKGKGILLLHDIQPATALALPDILKALKARGYRVVHVVPAMPDRPKTVTDPAQWLLHPPSKTVGPHIVQAPLQPPQLPVPSPQSFGWPDLFNAKPLVATTPVRLKLTRRAGYQTVHIVEAHWPASRPLVASPVAETALPAPSPRSFGIPHPLGPNIALPGPSEAAAKPVATNRTVGAAPSSVGLP
jgi:peptidoglycan/xylan/chitin deacetylase (PgdA/CDA1 family)